MRIDCLIVHDIPGRVRIRVSQRSTIERHSQQLASYLLGREGAAGVRINPTCASVIVDYDPAVLTPQMLVTEITRFLAKRFDSFPPMPDRELSQVGAADSRRELRRQTTISQFRNKLLRQLVGYPEFHPDQQTERAPTVVSQRQLLGDQGVLESSPDWHQRDIMEVVAALGSELRSGLTAQEAASRLSRFGPNALGRLAPPSRWNALAHQVASLPVALLLGSALVSAATAGTADAVVILGVVTINACIGYFTESQAEKRIASLQDEPDAPATVIRDGQRHQLAVESIVPGDLVVLVPGSTIPADLRLIEAQRLLIDESALTGEGMPVAKSTMRLPLARVPLRDRTNMVYRGTIVTGGSGVGVAVSTGERTEVGRIQNLVGTAIAPQTPVQRQLGAMGTQLGVLSGLICGGIFAMGLLRRHALVEMMKTTTSLAVAAIPEGLPMVATTTLALGVGHMRRLNVAIRRLDAVETLGSVDVFCLDKTGTLTLNQMRVVRLYAGNCVYAATQQQVLSNSEGHRPGVDTDHRRLIEICVLCNEADVTDQDGKQLVEGTATESALIRMALDEGINVSQLRRSHPVLRTEYRTDTRGYMSTLHHDNSGTIFWAVKGRPAEVLDLCIWKLDEGKVVKLSAGDRDAILAENENMAGKALRVLGVACSSGRPHDSSTPSQLIWLGLVGIADPLRPGMQELMRVFHQAGIRTIMITGDQSVTANAIGRELRLSDQPELRTLDSAELESLDPDLLKSLSQNIHVFSSVTPSHKLAIVQALQQAGKVVAMTGDGINDGPALKAANIGVAMGGDRGTDVARMTADVVLEDNNLQSMVTAIAQGRAIYSNTRNAIRYLIATNMSEIMVMGSAVAWGKGTPLNPIQLLWINLVSDIFPVIALAVQPPEPDVLSQPPRSADEPIFNPRELGKMFLQSSAITLGTFGSYAWGRYRYAAAEPASTMAFMSITAAQLLHMLGSRSDRYSVFCEQRPEMNAFLKTGLIFGMGLQWLTVAYGPLRRLLRNTKLSTLDLSVSAVGAGLPFVINEAVKSWQFANRPTLNAPREASSKAGGRQP